MKDHLDRAIDHVAARMTRVEHDDAIASHIVSALPERSIWTAWLFQSWAPRLAMIAVVIAAGLAWGGRAARDNTSEVAPLAGPHQHAVAVAYASTVREHLEPNRTLPLEPVEPLEPLEPRVDFEHSLPSIAAVATLELEAIAPASLPEDAPLTLAPLAIADLPAAESISPRQEL